MLLRKLRQHKPKVKLAIFCIPKIMRLDKTLSRNLKRLQWYHISKRWHFEVKLPLQPAPQIFFFVICTVRKYVKKTNEILPIKGIIFTFWKTSCEEKRRKFFIKRILNPRGPSSIEGNFSMMGSIVFQSFQTSISF